MNTRYQRGTVYLDRRTKVWSFRWRDDQGRRPSERIGTLSEFPSKAKAMKASEGMRARINSPAIIRSITLNEIAQRYTSEKMPTRHSTRLCYLKHLNNHILPAWGDKPLAEIKAYPVELWLKSVALCPAAKGTLRTLLRILIDCAMLWEYVEVGRNPMELVSIPGVTKRQKVPRILTMEEFAKLLTEIDKEPFRTAVLTDICLGLRCSELFALQWADLDCSKSVAEIKVQRAIVLQHVDDVKTVYSRKPMPLDPQLLAVLDRWRSTTRYSKPGDWVFASPHTDGSYPYSPWGLQSYMLKPAAIAAGIGPIGWHTFRHTYRTWLDQTGAPISVQQQLMRHTDIRTTMNIYGGVIPETNRLAHGKVVSMAMQAADWTVERTVGAASGWKQ